MSLFRPSEYQLEVLIIQYLVKVYMPFVLFIIMPHYSVSLGSCGHHGLQYIHSRFLKRMRYKVPARTLPTQIRDSVFGLELSYHIMFTS